MKKARRLSAQTTTEYMLVISVIVIAMAIAVYNPMKQAMSDGAQQFRSNATQSAKQGYTGTSYNGERR